MGFTLDKSGMIKGFDRLNEHVKEVVADKIESYSEQIENYMRQNAPWEDRTGEARRGLKAEVTVKKNGHYTIELSHTVPYGIYLEYREFSVKGRLSILEPTFDIMGNGLMEILEGII